MTRKFQQMNLKKKIILEGNSNTKPENMLERVIHFIMYRAKLAEKEITFCISTIRKSTGLVTLQKDLKEGKEESRVA